ncbi:phenylacetic acid degradation protein [Streptomyces fumanus]|uniref:Phenylacetic acid degradation protein n=1 Tax=Streptomyces fumanus TaxID=67302 RepID=A0A919AF67_9ACTN|nr:phenylacetic acid degradation protein [Streptomyces fumanus]
MRQTVHTTDSHPGRTTTATAGDPPGRTAGTATAGDPPGRTASTATATAGDPPGRTAGTGRTASTAPAGNPPRRTAWHRLRVTDVGHLTADTVAVTLDVPASLREVFAHRPGQHVVVRHRRAGGELRRSYSVCPPPRDPGALRLVIRRGGPDGFGAHATTRLAAGDALELSSPTGTFALPELPGGHHVLLAGGSGITPLATMAAHALRRDPACRVSLVHSVRTAADALLADELAELKDAFTDRFTVLYVLTREDRGPGTPGGRIDADRLSRLLAAVDARPGPDTAFALCGPPGLVDTARRVLDRRGADPALVRWELFTAPGTPPPPARTPDPAPGAGETRVTAVLDGRRRLATVRPQDPAILDALLRAHPDVPYACREGVCGSCRAKVLSGQVTADREHALDARDRAAGYTLTCRARPRTPDLTLDFDT